MNSRKNIATLNIVDLGEWCRNQYKVAKYPCDAVHRFTIGDYQVGQGKDWGHNASSDESYVAACLHWFMVAEQLGVHMENYISSDLFRGDTYMVSEGEYNEAHAKAAQMIIYGESGKKTKRSNTRYKPDVLGKALAVKMNYCMWKVDKDNVKTAMQLAMDILTGVL